MLARSWSAEKSCAGKQMLGITHITAAFLSLSFSLCFSLSHTHSLSLSLSIYRSENTPGYSGEKSLPDARSSLLSQSSAKYTEICCDT